MLTDGLNLIPLRGIKLVEPGDDLGAIAGEAFAAKRLAPEPGDVLVVAQKIVSKAEGRYVDVTTVEPSDERSRSPPRSTRTRASSRWYCPSRNGSCAIARDC